MTEARNDRYDTKQAGSAADSAFMLQLYRKQDPPGEIVLDYNLPTNETFLPIAEGRFLNISKLALRSGWLRGVSGIGLVVAFPITELIMLQLVKTPHYVSYQTHQMIPQSFAHTFKHTQGALEPTLQQTFSYPCANPTPTDPVLTFLMSIGVGLLIVIPILIVSKLLLSLIYTTVMMANLYFAHGSKCVSLLRSPTNIALSKASIKLMWSGKFFSQNGAMLAWCNVLALDFAPAEDLLSTAKILIKYKMPEGDVIFPFSLAGFNNADETILFMEFAQRYVPDEVKTSAFQQAYEQREQLARLAQKDVHEEMIAAYVSRNNIEQQTVSPSNQQSPDNHKSNVEPLNVQKSQVEVNADPEDALVNERDEAKALIESLSAVENEYSSIINVAQKDAVYAEQTN